MRAKVIAKGMAYAPAHGDTAFTVPMFDAYLKRVLPVLCAESRPGHAGPATSTDGFRVRPQVCPSAPDHAAFAMPRST